MVLAMQDTGCVCVAIIQVLSHSTIIDEERLRLRGLRFLMFFCGISMEEEEQEEDEDVDKRRRRRRRKTKEERTCLGRVYQEKVKYWLPLTFLILQSN